jgi:hypothetical protein
MNCNWIASGLMVVVLAYLILDNHVDFFSVRFWLLSIFATIITLWRGCAMTSARLWPHDQKGRTIRLAATT